MNAHIIFIFLIKIFFLQHKKYWSNKRNDPFLYKVNNIESLDIDTEEEFKTVENVYKAITN